MFLGRLPENDSNLRLCEKSVYVGILRNISVAFTLFCFIFFTGQTGKHWSPGCGSEFSERKLNG